MTFQPLAEAIITSRAGAILKRVWYALMPSFHVWRTVFGLKVCFDSRDHPFIWYTRQRDLENCEGIKPYLEGGGSVFWDIGSNAGIYALYAAKNGWKVTAFDLSPKCTALLKKSAQANNLKIVIVTAAFTSKPIRYDIPFTATAGNSIQNRTFDISSTSMTWREAETHFGTPHLIKMDIEGAELDLINDPGFRSWLAEHKITLLVEVHSFTARLAATQFKSVTMVSENTLCLR